MTDEEIAYYGALINKQAVRQKAEVATTPDKWTAVAEAMEARAKELEATDFWGYASGYAERHADGLREAAAMVRNAMGEGDDADT